MSVDRLNERKARVARASVIALASVIVAALSHTLAGGNSPTVFALLASTIIAIPLTLLLTHRRFGIAGMFTAVSITQGLFHTLFVYMGTSSGGSAEPLPAHAEHFGMVHSFVPVLPESAGPTLAMWLSHAVAALLTVWLIRRGDVALMRLAHLLTRVLWPHIQLVAQAPKRVVRQALIRIDIFWCSARTGFTISHRGPPAARVL